MLLPSLFPWRGTPRVPLPTHQYARWHVIPKPSRKCYLPCQRKKDFPLRTFSVFSPASYIIYPEPCIFYLKFLFSHLPFLNVSSRKAGDFFYHHHYLAHSRPSIKIFEWTHSFKYTRRCESRCQVCRWLNKSFNFKKQNKNKKTFKMSYLKSGESSNIPHRDGVKIAWDAICERIFFTWDVIQMLILYFLISFYNA